MDHLQRNYCDEVMTPMSCANLAPNHPKAVKLIACETFAPNHPRAVKLMTCGTLVPNQPRG